MVDLWTSSKPNLERYISFVVCLAFLVVIVLQMVNERFSLRTIGRLKYCFHRMNFVIVAVKMVQLFDLYDGVYPLLLSTYLSDALSLLILTNLFILLYHYLHVPYSIYRKKFPSRWKFICGIILVVLYILVILFTTLGYTLEMDVMNGIKALFLSAVSICLLLVTTFSLRILYALIHQHILNTQTTTFNNQHRKSMTQGQHGAEGSQLMESHQWWNKGGRHARQNSMDSGVQLSENRLMMMDAFERRKSFMDDSENGVHLLNHNNSNGVGSLLNTSTFHLGTTGMGGDNNSTGVDSNNEQEPHVHRVHVRGYHERARSSHDVFESAPRASLSLSNTNNTNNINRPLFSRPSLLINGSVSLNPNRARAIQNEVDEAPPKSAVQDAVDQQQQRRRGSINPSVVSRQSLQAPSHQNRASLSLSSSLHDGSLPDETEVQQMSNLNFLRRLSGHIQSLPPMATVAAEAKTNVKERKVAITNKVGDMETANAQPTSSPQIERIVVEDVRKGRNSHSANSQGSQGSMNDSPSTEDGVKGPTTPFPSPLAAPLTMGLSIPVSGDDDSTTIINIVPITPSHLANSGSGAFPPLSPLSPSRLSKPLIPLIASPTSPLSPRPCRQHSESQLANPPFKALPQGSRLNLHVSAGKDGVKEGGESRNRNNAVLLKMQRLIYIQVACIIGVVMIVFCEVYDVIHAFRAPLVPPSAYDSSSYIPPIRLSYHFLFLAVFVIASWIPNYMLSSKHFLHDLIHGRERARAVRLGQDLKLERDQQIAAVAQTLQATGGKSAAANRRMTIEQVHLQRRATLAKHGNSFKTLALASPSLAPRSQQEHPSPLTLPATSPDRQTYSSFFAQQQDKSKRMTPLSQQDHLDARRGSASGIHLNTTRTALVDAATTTLTHGSSLGTNLPDLSLQSDPSAMSPLSRWGTQPSLLMPSSLQSSTFSVAHGHSNSGSGGGGDSSEDNNPLAVHRRSLNASIDFQALPSFHHQLQGAHPCSSFDSAGSGVNADPHQLAELGLVSFSADRSRLSMLDYSQLGLPVEAQSSTSSVEAAPPHEFFVRRGSLDKRGVDIRRATMEEIAEQSESRSDGHDRSHMTSGEKSKPWRSQLEEEVSTTTTLGDEHDSHMPTGFNTTANSRLVSRAVSRVNSFASKAGNAGGSEECGGGSVHGLDQSSDSPVVGSVVSPSSRRERRQPIKLSFDGEADTPATTHSRHHSLSFELPLSGADKNEKKRVSINTHAFPAQASVLAPSSRTSLPAALPSHLHSTHDHSATTSSSAAVALASRPSVIVEAEEAESPLHRRSARGTPTFDFTQPASVPAPAPTPLSKAALLMTNALHSSPIHHPTQPLSQTRLPLSPQTPLIVPAVLSSPTNRTRPARTMESADMHQLMQAGGASVATPVAVPVLDRCVSSPLRDITPQVLSPSSALLGWLGRGRRTSGKVGDAQEVAIVPSNL